MQNWETCLSSPSYISFKYVEYLAQDSTEYYATTYAT